MNGIVPQGWGQQVLLYAKGWYGRTENGIISDLKVIMSKYSSLDIDYISDRDIWEILCRTAGDCIDRFDMGELLFETIGGKWKNSMERKPEEIVIGKLSIVDGEYVDKLAIIKDFRLTQVVLPSFHLLEKIKVLEQKKLEDNYLEKTNIKYLDKDKKYLFDS